ncbi:GTP cyclohydrolase IIa [Psychrilyobacter piezotolerans]|uniref:GTP cyclohydrolase IIa n=2 Tax=Fusobacteriaceae TaxID=203492 RepID=A0ABX9KCY1_9FUSO|nr:GGDEF domain-containing protein [Psychrilyobacter piezotolerans]RDE58834.1 GGDEF domain-containing protein [Psychrilyobacter sp. S5]REI39330.1 GTP cyclohydrolase IIa [Psychrilyobacter piezotolerans]
MPYLIVIAITLTLISLDMPFPKVENPTAWDIISELLICIQPLIWICFGKIAFRKIFIRSLYVGGSIIFYTGALQNVMDEIYEIEGFLSHIDKVLMPIGLMLISMGVVLSVLNERKDNFYISQKSIKDPLTKLYNRRYLEEKLESILNESTEVNHEISIAFIDIDNFKKINDTVGHIKGDEILRYIGKLINGSIRESDYAFRYGGDEFLIVYQNTTAEIALKITERIKDNFKKNILFHNYNLSLSSGIASYQRSENYKEFIRRADQAMYKSKINGKNRTTLAATP